MCKKFKLGSTYITRNASDVLAPTDVFQALCRHAVGDWGELGEEDRAENEFSLKRNWRLFSVYHDAKGTRFYVITEADRSATTVLLPDEY